MRAVAALFFLLCVTSMVAVNGAEVEVLTKGNFSEKVKKGVWLIKFYSPWCGHCKAIEGKWKDLARVVDGKFHVAEVNCVKDYKLCDEYNVNAYPTIKMIEPGLAHPMDVGAKRDVYSWVKFVSANARTINLRNQFTDLRPTVYSSKEDLDMHRKDKVVEDESPRENSDVIQLTGKDFLDTLSKGPLLVKFYSHRCGFCKKLAPTWEDLATKAKVDNKSWKVAKVNVLNEEKIGRKYNINAFPTVYLLRSGEKPVLYRGDRSVDSFIKFADSVLDNKKEL